MDVNLNNPSTNSAAAQRASLLDPIARLNKARRAAQPTGWDAKLNVAKPADVDAAKRLAILGAMNGPASLNEATGRPSSPTQAKPFADLLNDERATRAEATTPSAKHDALERTSQTLVNQFFMGSMLKQMRESPFKDELLSGGKGGAAFAGLFDQHLSEHAGSGIAKGLVKSMVRQYERASTGPTGLYAVPKSATPAPIEKPLADKPQPAARAERVNDDAGTLALTA